MRKTCLDMVHSLAKEDQRIVFIGSDLGQGTLSEFKSDIPKRFFMEGISEANIVGMAAGMAQTGKIVYINTIASFLTRRSFEQIVLDLCLHNLAVRLIGNGGGMVYAPLGPTHTTIEDIAIMRSLPNMTVVAPADADEMQRLMPQTVDWPGPIYIRLAKGYDPIVSRKELPFQLGKAIILRKGDECLLCTTGIALEPTLKAADYLAEKDINATVLHIPTIKPLDQDTILRFAKPATCIVTIEEHSRSGGLGTSIAELIAEAGLVGGRRRFKRLGLPDQFQKHYGSQRDHLRAHGITGEGISKVIMEMQD